MFVIKLLVYLLLIILTNLQISNCDVDADDNNEFDREIRDTTDNNNEINDRKFKIVETKSGSIRGQQFTTLFKTKKYNSFRGIPYAEMPIGDLRFKVVPKNSFFLRFPYG